MTHRTRKCNSCKTNQSELMFRKDKTRCMPCEINYALHEAANAKRRLEEASRPRNRWTDAELAILIQIMVYEEGHIDEVSKLCRRHVDLCSAKAKALGLKTKSHVPKNFHSEEEIAKVHYCMYVRGLSTALTARALGYKSHNMVIGINNRHIKPNPSAWVGRWSPPEGFSWPALSPKEQASQKSRSSLVSMARSKL